MFRMSVNSFKKRNRGVNYSAEEKKYLLHLIAGYKHILENKKNDTASVKRKNEVWEELTKQFNSKSLNNCVRTTDSLKKYYDNIKFKPKTQEIVNEMPIVIKMENVSDEAFPEPANDLDMTLVDNKETVPVLENRYALDSSEAHDETSISVSDIMCEAIITDEEPETTNWGNKSVKDLRVPEPKEISTKSDHRRRPNLNNSLLESHINLANAKIELVKLKQTIHLEEYNLRKERDEIEFQLRVKSLKLDIELKQAQLRNLEEVKNINS